MDINEQILEKIEELRELLRNNVSTKNEKIPRAEDLSKSKLDKKLDKLFDIDIFFSRKPGMRRSIQLVSSGTDKPENVQLSCMTALCGLCDTMVSNKELNMSEKEIIIAFLCWMEQHRMWFADLNKKDLKIIQK